jgi:pimeloyl-ACP methyl ester carboxylesterase
VSMTVGEWPNGKAPNSGTGANTYGICPLESSATNAKPLGELSTMTATRTIDVEPDLQIRVSEAGSGAAALVLHGGGGPATVEPIATHLAETHRALTPTHPGWNGSARPAWLTRIEDLSAASLNLLGELDLVDVLVVGSSLGGWIAAEMALGDGRERIGRLVLIDSVGVDVPGQPIRDFFALDARGVADYSYHDGDRFYVDPTTLPAEQVAARQANMATMRALAGDPYMHDPSMLGRLGQVSIPTLVLWGESDRIVTPDYGGAMAAAIPNARFEIVREAGHLPQLEQPEATFRTIDRFLVVDQV